MYPHQHERLTAALASHHLAALIATAPTNVFYLTEWRATALARSQAPTLVVCTPDGVALVIPAAGAGAVADAGVAVDHVIPYGRSTAATTKHATPGAAVAAALDALGASRGAVGLDATGLTPASAREIEAALGSRRVVPGSDAFLTARQVKGPWEIEALERSLIVAEEALNQVIQMLAPGVTEPRALELFVAEVEKRDARATASRIAFGAPEARRTGSASPNRALRAGDVIHLDVGCLWRSYHAGVARTAVMGAPTAAQETAFDTLLTGLDASIRAVRPGTVAGAIVSAPTRAGVAGQLAGHGIGLDAREAPALVPGALTVLEPGMVLQLEASDGGAQAKETVLVTTVGARVMNRSQRGLVVLD